jgi:hypothetical protein
MRRSVKIALVTLVAVGILVISSVYALFHGYFDGGQFEIKRFQWSSANQVAMVAERSDNDALGGLEYYVLIGNHLFTRKELRHAYYSNAVIFRAGSGDCLRLRWDAPNRLTIRCDGPNIDRDHINSQKQQSGDIEISYENIAIR